MFAPSKIVQQKTVDLIYAQPGKAILKRPQYTVTAVIETREERQRLCKVRADGLTRVEAASDLRGQLEGCMAVRREILANAALA